MTVPSQDIDQLCRSYAERASATRHRLAAMTGAERTRILLDMASALTDHATDILRANKEDIAASANLSPALSDRLHLDVSRLSSMADAIVSIAHQPDPLGQIVDGRTLPNGLRLEKRRVPIGVVLVIFESRPNVTSDAAALCIKSGNCVLLKGGREAAHTNRAVVRAIRRPLESRGIADALSFVDISDRSAIASLVRLRGLIDLCIPRGGPGLIDAVVEHARIPVIKHDAGLCHIYIDQHLDAMVDQAIRIVVNAKAQRPGVCNAVETLLVHEAIAENILPELARELSAAGVEIRADPGAQSLMPGSVLAIEDDWRTEYLALVLSVRVVPDLASAIEHIRTYGSQHTDAILTSSVQAADAFIAGVDSANVMVNCSTRFADGGEYGLGAEIGISTDKLHARGPMGAQDLTTYQWVMRGSGQIRS